MQRMIVPAFLVLAAAAGAVLAQAGANQATLVIRLPADAALVIGSQETQQRGSQRRFLSPELVPGYDYSYQLEARWLERGKEVKVTRSVTFRAGKTAVVDFLAAERLPKPLPKVVEAKPEPKVKAEPKPEKKVKIEPKPAPADAGFVSLFNGKDLTGWKTIPAKADKTYTVQDSMIVVSGNPNGYFYTDKNYKNYVLTFDWRYKRPAGLEDDKKFLGNSGLLVHIQEPHKVWPKSLEVQGMNRDHGALLPVSGAKLSNYKFNRDALEKARNKVGEWNTTLVTVKDGKVTAEVNGAPVSTGTFDLTEGPFGFQSEGAELHFKNIKILSLKDITPPPIIKSPQPPTSKKTGFQNLFNGTNLDGWKTFLKDESADAGKTFVVKDGEIQVSGFPYGFVHTDKAYKNYVIRYDWTYPKDQPEKTTMNSGLLLHIQTPNKVWPQCIEPQGRYKDHGKLFFLGFAKDAKTESKFDEAAQQKALRPSYEWNTTEATVKADGTISVKVNSTPVSQGKSELVQGLIGFQSEGARIHFRNIKIKMLDTGS